MDKIDTLIRKHPIESHIRERLTQDTMGAMIQVKRARLARHMLTGLFVITTVFLIGKWLSNDLVYLLQLLVNKFALIKSQSSLYFAALWESLPKQQLLIMFVAGILWLAWKQFETFLSHSRITRRRQLFTMRLIRFTPRLLLATTLIVISAVGFAGYSYAQRTEQKKLEILREHINQSGRTEFETNKSAKECSTSGSTYNDPNLTNIYEIKKTASLSTEDAKKVIEAACLQAEAQDFLYQAFNLFNPEEYKVEKMPSDSITQTSIVYQIIDKTDNSITVKIPLMSNKNEKIPEPSTSIFHITSDTKVYKNDLEVSQSILAKGDTVMLLNRFYPEKTVGGEPTRVETLGIYILPADPDFHWHSVVFQHPLTQIKTCEGNPQDRCSFTGSIDFFPSGGGEGNTVNPLFIHNPDNEMKEIAGVLTEIDDTSVKIKGSSGRIFMIEFGSNPVEEFNLHRAQYYNNEKVTIGDTLLIRYAEASNQHSTTINTNQIFNAVLMIEVTNKFDPVTKY